MVDLHYCMMGGLIGGGSMWLPTEPFDYGWSQNYPSIGCNHIRCAGCGEQVKATTGSSTRYACRCSSHVEGHLQPLGGDPNEYRGLSAMENPAPGNWACAGHPTLAVPSVLDGIQISLDRFREIARQGYASPPFVTQDCNAGIVWIERLYWILPGSLRPMLAEAVAELLHDDDPRLAVRAMSFFSSHAGERGGDRITALARDHERLAKIADPDHRTPGHTLEDAVLGALSCRAFRRDNAGALLDPEAHELLRRATRAGKNADDVIYTFARLEPEWLAANVAEIVRNAPSVLETAVWLFKEQPEELRLAAYRSIALDPTMRAALYKCIDAEFTDDDRAQLLAMLT